MYMTNPIVIHFMKINRPWSDYDRILFYEVVTMNFMSGRSQIDMMESFIGAIGP